MGESNFGFYVWLYDNVNDLLNKSGKEVIDKIKTKLEEFMFNQSDDEYINIIFLLSEWKVKFREYLLISDEDKDVSEKALNIKISYQIQIQYLNDLLTNIIENIDSFSSDEKTVIYELKFLLDNEIKINSWNFFIMNHMTNRLKYFDNRFDGIGKKVENLSSEYNETATKIKDQKIDLIGLMASMLSIFTFIGINISIVAGIIQANVPLNLITAVILLISNLIFVLLLIIVLYFLKRFFGFNNKSITDSIKNNKILKRK